ncbi:MAG: hypothetical protein R6U97_13475 [Desulfosalsimonas sp.]
MANNKRSFIEKLTGTVNLDDDDFENDFEEPEEERQIKQQTNYQEDTNQFYEKEEKEGQLSIDLYQTPENIMITTIVAGVKPEVKSFLRCHQIKTSSRN